MAAAAAAPPANTVAIKECSTSAYFAFGSVATLAVSQSIELGKRVRAVFFRHRHTSQDAPSRWEPTSI